MRGTRPLTWLGLVVGLALGFALSWSPSVEAARNASGTMSLVAGNPVVSGTTITTTWANNTLSDIKTEITDSLSRSGKGAMLAPLQLAAGSVGLPGLTFSSDTDTGLYRVAGDNPAISAGGIKAQEWTATSTSIAGTCAITGAVTASNGITVTNATANGHGITATGNGSGRGVTATSGTSGGAGGLFTGLVSGNGLEATGGTGTGSGVVATGGTSGSGGWGIQSTGGGVREGINAIGGATNGHGGKFTGGGTGAGIHALNGTDATAGTRRDAISARNGDIDMSNVTDPSSTVAISDRVTPMNVAKAWAAINIAGSGTQSVLAGFNVASLACASSAIQVTFAAPFSSINYGVVVGGTSTTRIVAYSRASASRVDFQFRDPTGALLDPCGVFSMEFSFTAYGAQ